MVCLIILNIILIVLVIFLVLYIIKNNKGVTKTIYIKDDEDDEDDVKIKRVKHKRNKKIKTERVFEGVFITDEEYQQMMENKRSDISILLEDIGIEYEHLKELNK